VASQSITLFHSLPTVINHTELIAEIEAATSLDWSADGFVLWIDYQASNPVAARSIRIQADDTKTAAIKTAVEAHAPSEADYSDVEGIALTGSVLPHIIRRVDFELPTDPKEVSNGSLINTTSGSMVAAISTTKKVKTDDLLYATGTIQISSDASDGTVDTQMFIDGVGGEKAIFKEPGAPNTNGNAITLSPKHFLSGVSGTVTIEIKWSVEVPETAYSASRRINIFKTKVGA